MSVHAVTKNSTAPRPVKLPIRTPANLPGRPTSPKVIPFPGKFRPPPKKQQKNALNKLLKKLLPAIRKSPFKSFGAASVVWFFVEHNLPGHWPGWDNVDAVWRKPEQIPLGFAIGDFVPNPFDHRSTWGDGWHALLDSNTCALPNGCRFWGDFPLAEPVTDPYAPYFVPATTPLVSPVPVPAAVPSHKPLPNLAPRRARLPRWRPTNNVYIEIPFPRPGARVGVDVKIKTNFPRVKNNDLKTKPASAAGYLILKAIADFGGETKEWIDILAEASDYHKDSLIIPEELHGRETLKKAWWLWVAGGYNAIDFELLFELAIENEIEDRLFALAGQASKFSAQGLGLTVGPQTGPLM